MVQSNDERDVRRDDPQIVLQSTLKVGERSDILVFRIPLSIFELICIVTIPEDGATSAPVYVKFKVSR